ncbi:ring-cleaving dioxygenase [Halopelagius longus]|uniref:Glyoxalase family protein n=1 Tax=Halopelagius longus TaxID=1236180 RepID=A0A1H0YH62_9EURY|nr:ring-cleaving dioxygenase [Halopelagius longus]RDI72493.1 ring-cleaving dioxygenase [Halopelagius longus]SDQ14579.1 glyoxalase family protein [Halopelagius longus]
MQTDGIHHVTAVSGDPRENVRFYADVLGLRLVKRTVNFDDTSTYHLYYGDETGSPGTALTFFPFGEGRPGRPGRGQAVATAFVVPEGSLDYWTDRFAEHGVSAAEPTERFGAGVVAFEDEDGQPLELVEGETDIEPWADGPVPAENAVRGFHGVTLQSAAPESTGRVLELLGFEKEAAEGERVRYRAAGDRANVVDLLERESPRGRPGVGTVHHVAFRAEDEEQQLQWREELSNAGQNVTPQKDRQYFQSIYFRDPGGVLFEIATDGPGFTRDESVEELGSSLKLPPWLEDDRDRLESRLPSLEPEVEEVRN